MLTDSIKGIEKALENRSLNINQLISDNPQAASYVLTELYNKFKEENKYKKELDILREKIKDLNNKSGQRAKCLEILPNRRILIKFGPFFEEVMVSPNIDIDQLKRGTEVLIIGSSEGRLAAEIRDQNIHEGRISRVNRLLDNNRIVIEDGGHSLILGIVDGLECKKGDEIRYDYESLLVLEILNKANTTYGLDKKITTTFNDLKGLDKEIKYIKERIIYPIIYKNKFDKYKVSPVHGALLHGPSGCGKSTLAAAIFNEIAIMKNNNDHNGLFIINGPEILSKWVGNAEEAIRNVFSKAREAAEKSGIPSIVFWDEIESVAGKRKDTASYNPEKTIVPTILSEMQGIHGNSNIIVIAASNRPDLIDPALIRPGRLGDIIIEIPKPSKTGAIDILGKYLDNENLPINLKKIDNLKNMPLVKILLKDGFMKIFRFELINGALFTQIGEELIRRFCINEIENNETELDILKIVDELLLNQVNVLNSNAKNGFNMPTSDLILDVTTES